MSMLAWLGGVTLMFKALDKRDSTTGRTAFNLNLG